MEVDVDDAIAEIEAGATDQDADMPSDTGFGDMTLSDEELGGLADETTDPPDNSPDNSQDAP